MAANSNHGKQWTSKDEAKLQQLAAGNTPTPLIAHKLARTESAVQNKAGELKVSLKPTNQSPYNRTKK